MCDYYSYYTVLPVSRGIWGRNMRKELRGSGGNIRELLFEKASGPSRKDLGDRVGLKWWGFCASRCNKCHSTLDLTARSLLAA